MCQRTRQQIVSREHTTKVADRGFEQGDRVLSECPVDGRDVLYDLIYNIFLAHDERCAESVYGGGSPPVSETILAPSRLNPNFVTYLELLPLLLKGLSSSIGNAYLRYPSQLVLKAPTTACARSSDDDGGEAYVGGGASSCLFGRSTGVFDGRADTSDKMPLPSAKDVRCIMTKRLLFTDVCGSKDDLYECVEQTWSTFRAGRCSA